MLSNTYISNGLRETSKNTIIIFSIYINSNKNYNRLKIHGQANFPNFKKSQLPMQVQVTSVTRYFNKCIPQGRTQNGLKILKCTP